ncbi:MAG: Spy/CpxP family protein refolding chaperone [Burkholderiales bacterium]|nr:Spy/CpxP family protein refolding chaperone [Burkholderiales bacterium]
MKSIKQKLLPALLAVGMSLGGSAYAQSTAPAGPQAEPMHASADPAKRAEKMQQRMARHQAALHDKLKLTAAQEPAWKTFTEALTLGAMPVMPDRKETDKLSTPERMEQALARMQEHQAKMQAHLSALKTFYAVLTLEQQKIFDDSHRRMARHMRERMAEHMGGHRPMSDHPPMMDKKP